MHSGPAARVPKRNNKHTITVSLISLSYTFQSSWMRIHLLQMFVNLQIFYGWYAVISYNIKNYWQLNSIARIILLQCIVLIGNHGYWHSWILCDTNHLPSPNIHAVQSHIPMALAHWHWCRPAWHWLPHKSLNLVSKFSISPKSNSSYMRCAYPRIKLGSAVAWRGLLCLKCFEGLCGSKNIHINGRSQGFPPRTLHW